MELVLLMHLIRVMPLSEVDSRMNALEFNQTFTRGTPRYHPLRTSLHRPFDIQCIWGFFYINISGKHIGNKNYRIDINIQVLVSTCEDQIVIICINIRRLTRLFRHIICTVSVLQGITPDFRCVAAHCRSRCL